MPTNPNQNPTQKTPGQGQEWNDKDKKSGQQDREKDAYGQNPQNKPSTGNE